jgi:nucleoside-diphosphate-sugar epimerase
MGELRGKRILVTGPAGQIGFPLARALARDNEVWGIARFGDAAGRQRCEAEGIRTRRVDLADPDWSGLPREFDYVLHLAIFQRPGRDYDYALRVNAEGTGLLMRHFRSARAILVLSSCAVYAPPDDPAHPVRETDPLGGVPQPFAETYPVSKLAQEAVARCGARAWNLPTAIARMNVAYGANGGLPAQHLDALLAGEPIDLQAGRASICCPIHEEDIAAQAPRLLAAASVPATAVNWAGDEAVDVRSYCRFLGELVERAPQFREVERGISHIRTDNTLRRSLAGDCRVDWQEGMRRMVAARRADVWMRAGG